MKNQIKFNDFIGLYKLSKTLRFKLIPQWETSKNIESKGLIKQDEALEKKYKRAKEIIDKKHKFFIEESLKNLTLNGLNEYLECYQSNENPKRKNDLEKKSETLRKQIVKQFAGEGYKRLFSSQLIKEDLPEFVDSEEDRAIIEDFKNFTTYFTGFHENRKNMYTDERKSTAIAYRLINENLPKFIDNMVIYNQIQKTELGKNLKELCGKLISDLKIKSIDKIFTIDYYNKVLVQSRIDIYNTLIGGKTLDDGTRIQGLNEHINLYNQKQKEKSIKLPKFKPLYKQILSEREHYSWRQEEFEEWDDNNVIKSIESFCNEKMPIIDNNEDKEISLKHLLKNISNYDLDRIYIRNDMSLGEISNKIFGNYSIIREAIGKDFESNNPRKKKESFEKYSERKSKYLKSFDSFSIGHINRCLQRLDEPYASVNIAEYFESASEDENLKKDLFSQIEDSYDELKEMFTAEYPQDRRLSQSDTDITKIKNLLDSIKALQLFIKPLLGKGNEANKDEVFYSEISKLWESLNELTPFYNKVRNYITRKPYSTEKFKLNFESPTLLDGWDKDKETANIGVILRKNGLYYLGIIDKMDSKIFEDDNIPQHEELNSFEKMEYKFFKDITTMIPKCSTQLNSVKNHFQTETSDYILNDEKFNKPLVISKDIYDLNNPLDKGGKKKFQIEYFRQTGDEAGYKAAVKKWIMFCMDFLYSYKSTSIHDYSSLNPISKFDRVDKFYNEVNKLIYKVTFRTISEKYIRQLVLEGKLYLFQIYNKDFSSYSTGTPNMHTLYWKMLFDPLNLRDVVYKLDGQAEIFYRKSSIKKKDIIVHPSNNAIANKNKSNNKKKSTFNYDIIKDRRFTVDQYQFHVPITLNFKADAPGNINEMVNSFLKNSQNIYIIGIDRGERHLIYVSLIDEKGNIKKQFSLNDIVNEYKDNKYKTDYRGLLDSRESERDQARKDWKTIKTIKELKEGYLSQVIHKITRLMIEYKAIIVLEDLNTGFKRSRQKVEKQIYQKFEKMLIDKLNYLADKKTDPTKEGGILKAYQLSNKFESFQKMGKQSGFLFYVPAWNTSKIDSVTGFVNFFDTSYKNIDETKKFFEKFKSITFNKKENFFEFEVDDYSKFSGKAEGTRAEWVICTNGTRLESFRNQEKKSQWDSREIDLTEEFKKLFMGRIDIDKDIRTQVLEQEDKDFFERLLYLFRMTVQLRNSITGSDTDYILSPVPDKNGKFFDSRKAGPGLPDNADANGAYNIARKGLFLIEERIKEAEDMKKIDLSISNKDWLRFVQRNG